MSVWRALAVGVVLATVASSSAMSQSPKLYLLSATELAPFREIAKTKAEDGTGKFERLTRARTPFDRVIAHIADKRGGDYSGNNWSVFQTFDAYFRGPGPEIDLAEGRYLIAAACRWHSCGEKASAIIDLKTGHIAFALLHRAAASGKSAVTRFMKTCADRELRAFAETHFVAWATAAVAGMGSGLMQAPTLATAETRTLTTRC
jgi:hypothetical protein